MRICLLIAVSILIGAAPPQLETSVEKISDDYLASIQAQDWERMGSLLSDASRYEDFTMEFFDRPPIQLTGREAIVEFWRTSSEDSGTSSIHYDVVRRIVAGPMVILDLRGRVTVSGHYWELERDEITLEFDQISTLRILDGVVVHHVDHVDYADGMRQIDEQRRREASGR